MCTSFKEDLIHDLIEWIEMNIHEKMSVVDVAARSGYSKFYLHRLFKSVTGQGIAEYIRNRRLEKACEDVKQCTLTIMDISFKYGYESQQVFSRIFKSKFDIPPLKYRQLHVDCKGAKNYCRTG
ncbi:helix-turn-helix domain-containing protein [Erwinia billingiae]|uniref:helix-turn-helix domain-containing protein n=1 Tax=Erwinia billingiae TaxID=182337 RepID=UPI003208B44A